MSFIAAVTSVGLLQSRLTRHVRNSRFGIVSNGPGVTVDFGGQNTEAAPYPSWFKLFPVRHASLLPLTGKGLMPLSSLSFSRSAFLGRTPEVVRLRLVGVITARLPTPACVKRTCRAFHPIGHRGCGPNPAGGFAVVLGHRSPALDMTDLPHCSGRRVPLARLHRIAME